MTKRMDKATASVMVRYYRQNLTQKQLGHLVWPDDDIMLARNRITQYESGGAIPPIETYAKIKEIGLGLMGK